MLHGNKLKKKTSADVLLNVIRIFLRNMCSIDLKKYEGMKKKMRKVGGGGGACLQGRAPRGCIMQTRGTFFTPTSFF